MFHRTRDAIAAHLTIVFAALAISRPLGCTKDVGQVFSEREDEFMSSKRRKFSAQFKAEAVQMVLETGAPIAKVAKDLQINEGTLGNWIAIWRRDNPEPEAELTSIDRARISEMEEEIRRLRMENEFLKKAAAYVGDRCQAGVLSSRLSRVS